MNTIRMGACPICQDPMMRCLAPFDYGWVNHALTSSRNCPLFGKTSSAEWAKRTGHHYPYDEEQTVAAPPLPESPWKGMENKAFVLTREINRYDQDGEYFVAWFPSKPTIEQIQKITNTISEDLPAHILAGGGRIKWEDEWYHLREVAAPDSPKGGEG